MTVRRRVQLATRLPGPGDTTVWADPASRSPERVLPPTGIWPAPPNAPCSTSSSCSPRTRGRPNPGALSTPWTRPDGSNRSPCWARSPVSPTGSASPPRSAPPSVSRTDLPAGSPPWTTAAAAGPAGTWSPPVTAGRAATSGAEPSRTAPSAARGRPNSSPRQGNRGTPGLRRGSPGRSRTRAGTSTSRAVHRAALALREA